MTQENQPGLGYDEVLLVPAASNVLPHTVSLATKLNQFGLKTPLMANGQADGANDYVLPMALAGGLSVITATDDVSQQVKAIETVKEYVVATDQAAEALVGDDGKLQVAAELWLASDASQRLQALVAAGVDAVVLYLNQTLTTEMLTEIKSLHAQAPEVLWLVGVIEDPKAARQLYEAGMDGVIAGRSVDSQLPNNSHYPFLTVTMGIAEVAADLDKAVVAGSGVHYSGDVVKALAGGADAVLITDYLAGDEAPADAIFQIDGGLRAGMGYTGSKDVPALKQAAQFVQITDNGLRESHPHDVEITKQAPNYLKEESE
ncbi:IMP dehydrogenase [Convivina praedatoris]|uniref:Inosine-5'-monophosphate dehydrogenase n=1 Tax=Convivina praedatoris TaxID=2880963 RepID=A0ABM9D1V0_9LACO|nr:IMP dehydrogenase [Convivina sp. LMG 32447]CAH1850118.1 Inosine-5'-monophosphate dehydrogenase [Convivina sp. LMG 32447]CAH1850125.1 Inosine-5'-monophosphate dehydrogenase [Convivina sp. LMG 32447]CAH1851086.1 Inosine-5'-monophosphate dehydrogenase [Convivina sp. LMG 32447]